MSRLVSGLCVSGERGGGLGAVVHDHDGAHSLHGVIVSVPRVAPECFTSSDHRP